MAKKKAKRGSKLYKKRYQQFMKSFNKQTQSPEYIRGYQAGWNACKNN